MTPVFLLEAFKTFATDTLKDLILPVRPTKEEPTPSPRAPAVHLMNMPEEDAGLQKAPYVLLQLLNGTDNQDEGDKAESFCNVRVVACVYCDDAEEGGLNLLNVLVRLRTALLRKRIVGQQFTMRLPLEYLVYPDNIPPYYWGEMMTTWEFQTIEREVLGVWPEDPLL